EVQALLDEPCPPAGPLLDDESLFGARALVNSYERSESLSYFLHDPALSRAIIILVPHSVSLPYGIVDFYRFTCGVVVKHAADAQSHVEGVTLHRDVNQMFQKMNNHVLLADGTGRASAFLQNLIGLRRKVDESLQEV